MSGKLKEVKTRIASVKNTQQITKAMKLVAASKLKKATDLITQIRPYETKLSEMMNSLTANTEGDISVNLNEEREVNKVLIVVVTSDKGLCGAFNTNVVKQAKAQVEKYGGKKITLKFVGKKGHDAMKKLTEFGQDEEHRDLFKSLNFADSAKAVETIIESFTTGAFDKVIVCYSKFRNAAVQEFMSHQFLPIPKAEKGKGKKNSDFIFEPSKQALLEQLLPKIMNTQFYRFLLDSNASEHGARMTAMESATENANELLNDLKISYNKARQASITTELTEIVSGAAALEGS